VGEVGGAGRGRGQGGGGLGGGADGGWLVGPTELSVGALSSEVRAAQAVMRTAKRALKMCADDCVVGRIVGGPICLKWWHMLFVSRAAPVCRARRSVTAKKGRD
jgi:hypothetical protein